MRYLSLLLAVFFLTGCGDSDVTENGSIQNVENQTSTDSSETGAAKFILQDLLAFNSEQAVIDSFGSNNVKHALAWYPEGMGQYQTTYLYPDTKNQVQFVWKDDTAKFEGLQYIELYGDSTDWKTSGGITFGTTLRELEKINNAPFEFYGFGWDYGGTVRESNGNLTKRNIYLTLNYNSGDLTPEQEEKLIGDQIIQSNSAEAQLANPSVFRIRILK